MCQTLFWNVVTNTMGTKEFVEVYYAGVGKVSAMTHTHLHFNELRECKFIAECHHGCNGSVLRK